ncbi:Na(+)/H(+) antiporter subunit G [Gordonia araii NBRC 100433]|uniref:Na(+)/H(+) antiporter subunit G n=1 Tax=Gordonia araii NBRC 100433 TaxID=1073574 RepID=G7GXY3_9ACTN|nr:monovalent cation/H(+) antiporter subunit G [Gordonia araii]NNG98070.1 monovalent cation/H(+) antiporter subunit G [Gordonia araii NBRC 100433]GAB08458.1 Na(+)/H(+) antiporter subunit G [Gordonia araii NBRC 100433]
MTIPEIISTVLVIAGSLIALTASVGLIRFRDTLSRMHAATKPQTFGLLLVLTGAGIRLGGNVDIGMLVLAGLFALITAPVVAQRIGQLAYREQRAASGLTRSPTEVPTSDEK